MKHKVIGICGLLLVVLGVILIILQLVEGEKSVVKSIAASATPIWMGSILFAMSRMMKRRKASRDPSNTPK